MKKEITVNKAIKRWYFLSGITIFVSVAVGILLYRTIFDFLLQEKESAEVTSNLLREEVFFETLLKTAIICVLIFLALRYLAKQKWKVWAFRRVKNVHFLKKRADIASIIYADSAFYQKIETNYKYRDIRFKFEQEKVQTDNDIVIEDTIIYNSTIKNWLSIIVGGFILFLAFVSFRYAFAPSTVNLTPGIILGGFFSYFGIVMFVQGFVRVTKREPQIILSDKGIKIKSVFYEWREIKDEKIETEKVRVFIRGTSSIRVRHYYLTFKHRKGIERINFTDFDVDKIELGKLLVFYRERNKLRNNQKTTNQ